MRNTSQQNPDPTNFDRGVQVGQIEGRLDNIEKQQSALWDKLDELTKAIQRVQLTLATSKGVIMAVSWVVSGLIAFLVSWLSRK